MAIQKLRQANKLTQARYELSLVEKRAVYLIIKEVRQKYILTDEGQKSLFGDLIITFDRSMLEKEASTRPDEMYKGLEKLRTRSITIEEGNIWLNVGFINYSKHYKNQGKVEIQVSKEILPYLVELAGEYTEYSLTVAMSLNSEYSQRFYEYCAQWRTAGGFEKSIDDLRKHLCLEKKYIQYGALKVYVLETAKKELKKLYDLGQCDLYFNYSEIKEGRKVVKLIFKVISNKKENKLSLDDLLYQVRTRLKTMFETDKKPKNKEFISKVMVNLRLEPELLKHCNSKLEFVKNNLPKKEWSQYMRFVINQEYLNNDE